MTRFARRVDNNAQPIIDAFRGDGAAVKVIHEPVDLEVLAYPEGHEKYDPEKYMFVEIKNMETAYGRKGPNAKQLASMKGKPWVTVWDEAGALGALRVLRA